MPTQPVTPADERRVVDAAPTQLFIAGEWRAPRSGDAVDVTDPSTEETLAAVADASAEDATTALDAACAAQDDWAATAPRDRGEILRRAYEKLNERADELATLMTLEMGKPVAESKAEIAYAADFFHWFSGQATRVDGRMGIAEKAPNQRMLVFKQPIGPCVLITPWNFPMAMGTRKIGPAIAAGCTMVMKPAKQTPLSMLALAQILEEAGLP